MSREEACKRFGSDGERFDLVGTPVEFHSMACSANTFSFPAQVRALGQL